MTAPTSNDRPIRIAQPVAQPVIQVMPAKPEDKPPTGAFLYRNLFAIHRIASQIIISAWDPEVYLLGAITGVLLASEHISTGKVKKTLPVEAVLRDVSILTYKEGIKALAYYSFTNLIGPPIFLNFLHSRMDSNSSENSFFESFDYEGLSGNKTSEGMGISVPFWIAKGYVFYNAATTFEELTHRIFRWVTPSTDKK